MWSKAFFRWVQAQGRSPDTPGEHKNASGHVGIPLKGAPQAFGNEPSSSKEGENLEGCPRLRLEERVRSLVRTKLEYVFVIVACPTDRTSVKQGLFLGGYKRRTVEPSSSKEG